MRRILGMFTIVAATSLLSAASIIGAEAPMDKAGQKDQCLLVATYCANNVDSINQRIERLNKEIAKGSDVYTPQELRKLKDKLDEAIKDLGILTAS